MPVVFAVTILVIAAGRAARHAFGLSRVSIAGALVVAGVLLWLVARRVHAVAIRRVARELATPTGGSHGVPRWVEELRNVAFGLALAGLIPLVDELVPE